MEFKNIKLNNFNSITLFITLAILPNLLGMINLSTPFGFKIHFFQIAIFIAAMAYGPIGGLTSGLIGSVFSSIIMSNPYIILFNAVLGFFTGYFYKNKKYHIMISMLLAMLIQVPLFFIFDTLVLGLPLNFVITLIIALLISNSIWTGILSKWNKNFH